MPIEKRKKAVVVIPTYNERENVLPLLSEILGLRTEEDLSILVVDDDSPDGTGAVVSALAQKEKNIHLLTRKGKEDGGRQGLMDSQKR